MKVERLMVNNGVTVTIIPEMAGEGRQVTKHVVLEITQHLNGCMVSAITAFLPPPTAREFIAALDNAVGALDDA